MRLTFDNIDIKGGVGNRFQHRIDYRSKALGQSLAIFGKADATAPPQAQNGILGKKGGVRPTGHCVEGALGLGIIGTARSANCFFYWALRLTPEPKRGAAGDWFLQLAGS